MIGRTKLNTISWFITQAARFYCYCCYSIDFPWHFKISRSEIEEIKVGNLNSIKIERKFLDAPRYFKINLLKVVPSFLIIVALRFFEWNFSRSCVRDSRTIVLSASRRRTTRNRCWPFCFLPLMMKRAKKVCMICPLCGHVYRTLEYKNAKLTPCKSADTGDTKARLAPSASFRVQAMREE